MRIAGLHTRATTPDGRTSDDEVHSLARRTKDVVVQLSHLHDFSQPIAARTIHVMQGGFEASASPDEMFTTILGSCVCTCLCDPVARVGGLNHFLLPDAGGSNSRQLNYGLHAMELLINGLLKLGASKDRLEAKVFGGAMMNNRLGSIGRANADFALRFLETEAITCVAKSLGGTMARRVRYWPTSGRAQQMFLGADTPPPIEQQENPTAKGGTDDVTFF